MALFTLLSSPLSLLSSTNISSILPLLPPLFPWSHSYFSAIPPFFLYADEFQQENTKTWYSTQYGYNTLNVITFSIHLNHWFLTLEPRKEFKGVTALFNSWFLLKSSQDQFLFMTQQGFYRRLHQQLLRMWCIYKHHYQANICTARGRMEGRGAMSTVKILNGRKWVKKVERHWFRLQQVSRKYDLPPFY